MEELIVVNRPNQIPFLFGESSEQKWAVWTTCVRQLAIGFGNDNALDFSEKEDCLFHGEKAYRFSLEVVSGLHSPMFGETEVQGQFKEFFESFVYPLTPWGQQVRQFVQKILQDSKVIRENCLKGLGSQTYGGILRKRLKNEKFLTILGAGALVESVLPWLIDEIENITVACRQKHQKVNDLMEKFPKLRVVGWNDKVGTSEIAVVAAPISSREFKIWQDHQNLKFRIIIDLRESSTTDPVIGDFSVITLKNFFDEIQKTQSHASVKLKEAFRLANKLSALRTDAVHIRPFGWEDLCV